MRPTRTDTSVAVILAVGLHVLLLVGIFYAPRFRTPPAQGVPVVADLIDPRELSPALLRALDPLPAPALPAIEPTSLPVPEIEPPPQPLPDLNPLPEPEPPPEPAPEPEPEPVIDPEAAQREAERLREEALAAAQAEEERKQREAAEQKRREAERQLAQIRAQREQAEREQKQAEANLRDLQDRRDNPPAGPATPASPPPGVTDGADSLRAQWISALLAKIEREWIRPDTIRPGSVCPIRIRMLAGGEVRSAEIQPTCPYDEAARRSVEAAVLKASPLPWAGYESVAVRDFVVRFQPSSR